MDIMELGAIGELVGGVAVIASLIFVGLQIRLNATALRQNSTQGAIETWASMNMELARDKELAFLTGKVMAADVPDDLDAPQFAQLSYVLRAMVMRLEAEYLLYTTGAMEEELWQRHRAVAHRIFASPIGERWWARQMKAEEHLFTGRFIAEVRGHN